MTDFLGFPPAFDPKSLAETMQRQFGWDQKDVLRAAEALMPAALAGLKYNASTPAGLASLMALLPGPGAAKAAPSPGSLFGEPLALVFGPAEVQKAIADQVARSTGLGRAGIETIMPVVATLTVGNIVRQFTVGPAREMLDAFLAGYARGRPKPVPNPAQAFAPIVDVMRSFWDGYLTAGSGTASETERQSEADVPAPETPADDQAGNGDGTRLVESWLTLGRDIQDSQIKAFERLFAASMRSPG